VAVAEDFEAGPVERYTSLCCSSNGWPMDTRLQNNWNCESVNQTKQHICCNIDIKCRHNFHVNYIHILSGVKKLQNSDVIEKAERCLCTPLKVIGFCANQKPIYTLLLLSISTSNLQSI